SIEPLLDLLLRQSAAAGIEPFERLLGRANGQIEQRARPELPVVVSARMVGTDRRVLVHGAPVAAWETLATASGFDPSMRLSPASEDACVVANTRRLGAPSEGVRA